MHRPRRWRVARVQSRTVACWAATGLVERDAAEPTDALRLGRMRVFSEEVRRWKLVNGARPDSVLNMAVGADGATHVAHRATRACTSSPSRPTAHEVTHRARRSGGGCERASESARRCTPCRRRSAAACSCPAADRSRFSTWRCPHVVNDAGARRSMREDEATLAQSEAVRVTAFALPDELSKESAASVARGGGSSGFHTSALALGCLRASRLSPRWTPATMAQRAAACVRWRCRHAAICLVA